MKVVKLENNPNLFDVQDGNIRFNAAARPSATTSSCAGALNYVEDENYTGSLPSTPNFSWWVGQLTKPGGFFPGGIPSWDSSKPLNQQNPKIQQFIRIAINLYGIVDINITNQDQWTQYLNLLADGQTSSGRSPMLNEYCAEWKKGIRNFEESTKAAACDWPECRGCSKRSSGKWRNSLCGSNCFERKIWVCHECRGVHDCTKDKAQYPCWKCEADPQAPEDGRYCQEVDPPPDGLNCVTPTPSPTPSPSPSPSVTVTYTGKIECQNSLQCEEDCSCKNPQGGNCGPIDIGCTCDCDCDCSILDNDGHGVALSDSCKPECCCGDSKYKNLPFCAGAEVGILSYECPTPTPPPTPTATPTPATPTPATPTPATPTPATPTPTPPSTYGI